MMTETSITVNQDTASPGHNGQPTVKTDPGHGQNGLAWITLNFDYFRTIPGLLKLIELVFGIICMACASPALLSGTHWFLFVVVTSFISSLIWTFIYLLSIREALKLPINWILTELLNTFIITVLYLIAFIVQLSVWSPYLYSSWRASNIAAGVFGLFNFIVYGAASYFLFYEWKGSQSAN